MENYDINNSELAKKFKRLENKEDVKYRKRQKAFFENELKKVLPNDCDLCFHGTTIWNTEQIIKSGEISAQVDRVGLSKDVLNTPGQIYVSTINNVWYTIKYFADLWNYKYPAGCIFVIKPKSKKELKSAIDKNLIDNVDFKLNPKRLKAIITTPENIQNVRNWIKESKLKINTDAVVDYQQFINNIKSIYNFEENSIKK